MEEKVGIAILDSGINANHIDFDNRVVAFKDFVNDKNYPYDDNGHGTHVAGIACGSGKASRGKYKGIAPTTNIIALKVLDKEGKGKSENVIKALEWVVSNKMQYNIRVVNISFGTVASDDNIDDKLIKMIENVWDENIVVVAAAGNLGPSVGSVTIPGTSKKIITVGCVDDSDMEGGKRNYSGRGPTSECIVKPEILAYGNRIMSCGLYKNGYVRKSGTSMAAPYVAGAIARCIAKYPRLQPVEIKMKLRDTAIRINAPKEKQGWGVISLKDFLS